MRRSRWALGCAALAAAILTLSCCAATPAPASAGIIPEGACSAIGDLSSLGGKACEALKNPGQLLKTGKSLITGHIGSAIKDFFGNGGASSASTALSLAAIVAWIVDGARAAVHNMGNVINETAAPQLATVWFSSTYWRMAAVAALLTLPFLFAAAVQALLRSDLSLLAQAAFGHLPLALVGVGIAAPVTMLLLSGTDELCGLVWSPSSSNGLTSLFAGGGTVIGIIGLAGSPFLAFLLCLFTAAAGIIVWLELAMREAAVYIVVLLLPLAFAALVWPARRVWAVRAVEILMALILSKFAIVAVLGLGGTAMDQAGAHGLSAMLAGMVLVLLAALAPWAVLRLVPLAEVASSAASALRPHAMASLQNAWPSKAMRERAEGAIAGVGGDLADLVRLSSNGRATGPDPAMSNGYSRNGTAKPERAPYDWRRDTLEAPDGHEGDVHEEEAGSADDADRVDLAASAGGVDLASHADPPDVSDPGAFLDAESTVASQGAPASASSISSAGTARSQSGAPDERVPGADPLWQAPDMSWPPLPLGLDQGWPPDPPWPGAESRPEDSSDALGGDPVEQTGVPPPAPPSPKGTAERSDPLPPVQDRGEPL